MLFIFILGVNMERKPMTATGKKGLENLLKKLIHEERPKVIQAIKEARAHGDLSENADYDAAKEQQALLESRISDLRHEIISCPSGGHFPNFL